jgi:hypothetical protein
LHSLAIDSGTGNHAELGKTIGFAFPFGSRTRADTSVGIALSPL